MVIRDAANEREQVRVQLCLSPHCSTVASLLEAASTCWWAPDEDGWQGVHRAVAEGLDLRALAPYTAYPVIPRFLTSALDVPAPTFADQIDEIRSTHPARARREIGEAFGGSVPRVYEPFLTDPRSALDRLCAAMEAYWEQVVEPYWPRIRAHLEREIARVAYEIATRPPERALAQFHPAIAYSAGVITISSDTTTTETEVDDRLVMLTPLACAADGVIADLECVDRIKIGYAAPGTQDVWNGDPAHAGSDDTALVRLLGRTRARILLGLDGTTTTSSLSAALELPLATVSGHLSELRSLGLASSQRIGRIVEYRRTELGDNLRAVFSTSDAVNDPMLRR